MSSLPATVALKTVHQLNRSKYLGVKPDPDGGVSGKLQYAFPVLNPQAKFALEPSKHGENLFHIRSCYTNRYWVRQSNNMDSGPFILAAAKEPEENQSLWNCTLFRITIMSGSNPQRVQFTHVQTNRSLYVVDDFLSIRTTNFVLATSDVINYDQLVILPKLVAFMGDNRLYLKAYQQNRNYLQQYGDNDLGSRFVPQEVHPDDDGNVRIKNVFFNGFWQNNDPNNWVHCTSDGTNLNSLYKPIYIQEEANGNSSGNKTRSIIALRSFANNQFLKRYSVAQRSDCLRALASHVEQFARIGVAEPVLNRVVKVTYNKDAAMIYGVEPFVLQELDPFNNFSNETITVEKFIEEQVNNSKTFETSVSVTYGVSMSLSAQIPFIAEGGIEYRVESTAGMQFGVTTSIGTTAGARVIAPVPPKHRARLRLVSSKGKCNIPFSYVQEDRLTNGQTVINTFYDGVFTGIDYFNVQGSYELEPITTTSDDLTPN